MSKDNIKENAELEAGTSKAERKPQSTASRKAFSAVFIVIFILLFVGINLLSIFLVDRFPGLSLDLTSDGAYTIQDTTREYLDYVEDDIAVKVLISEEEVLGMDTNFGYQVNQLLHDFDGYKNISLEYMDVELTSVTTLQSLYPGIDWQGLSAMLLIENETNGKYEAVLTTDVYSFSMDPYTGDEYISAQNLEKCVLSAIQRTTSEKIVKIAMSVGNGEFVAENSQYYSSFMGFAKTLGYNAYDVENVNLLTAAPPEDADILMMIAPAYDLTDNAVKAVSEWLQNGGEMGKTLFYVPFYSGQETPNIDLLLEQWGLSVIDGYITEGDETKMIEGSSAFLVDYANDTFTEGLKDTSISVVMGADCMPVEITDTDMASSLLVSSDKSRVTLIPSTYDETTTIDDYETMPSREGGFNAAAISTKNGDADTSSSVVVWGSAAGIMDSTLKMPNYNNQSYLVNLLNTLCDNQLEGIIIDGVVMNGSIMTVTDAHKAIFRILFVIVVPIALTVVGIVVFVRRRNR
ncbi:MAG: GldG family protein [Eubacteriales bacterium]|nr:GldG family protein [Eubacteriales bacterium]